MKNWISLIGLPAVAAFLVCLPVWAQESDGHVSEKLANEMYCSVGGLLEGDIGLLLGLILVFIGIWAMVQGAKIVTVIPVIIIGALVTALPSLIESSFGGLGVLLVEANISPAAKNQGANSGNTKSAFAPPTCPAPDPSIQLATQNNSDNGHYTPPTVSTVKAECPPGAGGSVCQ